jgi:antitoxin (DNA-binding transcriptional repressor) of toxin-antitoxin stability system
MPTINMFEAKSSLSRFVSALESGEVHEYIIARNGHPAAKLVPLDRANATNQRIGVAKGRFTVPDSIDLNNDTVEKMFAGD